MAYGRSLFSLRISLHRRIHRVGRSRRNLEFSLTHRCRFATGYNFFCSQAALVLFEVVAFGLVIGYWASAAKVSDAVYITLTIVAYAALNLWSAKFFGNAELYATGFLRAAHELTVTIAVASQWARCS